MMEMTIRLYNWSNMIFESHPVFYQLEQIIKLLAEGLGVCTVPMKAARR